MASLCDVFSLNQYRYIFLIGGGGKTTTMFAVAHELAGRRQSVITTTSTRIRVPSKKQSAHLVVNDAVAALIGTIREPLARFGHVTVGKQLDPAASKVKGFSAQELDALKNANCSEYLIVEADGASGKPLKAHADHEPVVSRQADLVICVVGIDALGTALTNDNVHRADVFQELTGQMSGSTITPASIAAVITHPQGYLRAVPRSADIACFITKVTSGKERRGAQEIIAAIGNSDNQKRIQSFVIGSVGPQHVMVASSG